jgi:ubiquitin-protein ligase
MLSILNVLSGSSDEGHTTEEQNTHALIHSPLITEETEPIQEVEEVAVISEGLSKSLTLDDLLTDLNINETTQEGERGNGVNAPLPPNFKRVTKEKEPEYGSNAVRQIMRELKEMNQLNFAEEQLCVEMEGDDPFKLIVKLTPNDGLYKDGYYEITMELTEEYPHKKPTFHCKSQIFHPNIDYNGKICFSLLDEDGQNLRLADYAHGFLWLLYYPNLYSRLNSLNTHIYLHIYIYLHKSIYLFMI